MPISSPVVIAHGNEFKQTALYRQLEAGGFHCVAVSHPHELSALMPAVLLLDSGLLRAATLESWRAGSDAMILVPQSLKADGDIILDDGWPERSTAKLLQLACQQWSCKREQEQLVQAMHRTQEHLTKMANIGVALSAEKDLTLLLSKILSEGQGLVGCDAASLFLLDKSDPGSPKLIFKLTQNSSIPAPFQEQQLSLTKNSIVGYVAITNEELNIPDAHEIPLTAPYSFNNSFDKAMGYRSVSLLAIPMRNYRQQVIGVLEFINRKRDPTAKLNNPLNTKEKTLAFDEESASLLRALAGQAAVAIENNQLIDRVNRLFDGFVQASVVAIEQRDPTTSGHSFRVADLSVHLARALPASQLSRFRQQPFSSDEVREIRFAALLHDFGKVGVREHVLTKAKKLPEKSIETLRYRVALAKESIRNRSLQTLLNAYDDAGVIEQGFRDKVFEEVRREELLLDNYLQQILAANEPTVLDEGSFEYLQEIHNYLAKDCDGRLSGLISDREFCALSLRKGSLTETERKEIQSHVSHTLSFLQLIPWTPELRRVPEIAGSHHEKLDGSGYPKGLVEAQIPLPAKIMTICDIYDALTASDRPYKTAVPVERALSILEAEAKSGMLDRDLVRVFVEARSFEVVQHKNYCRHDENVASYYQRHVCDYDLERVSHKV